MNWNNTHKKGRWKWLCYWIKMKSKKIIKTNKKNSISKKFIDMNIRIEKNRWRNEVRVVKIYNDFTNINIEEWKGLKSFIKIYRKVFFKGKPYIETSFFISSLSLASNTAKYFQEGIRSHWSIESFHWIKDVSFREDLSKVSKDNAPENYSLLRNFTINIFRKNWLNKIQATIEKCANNVSFMMGLI